MKKGRFLWSAHRITEKQKAGKARNIKEKQLKTSRSTVSKLPVVRLSSPRDNRPDKPIQKCSKSPEPCGFPGFFLSKKSVVLCPILEGFDLAWPGFSWLIMGQQALFDPVMIKKWGNCEPKSGCFRGHFPRHFFDPWRPLWTVFLLKGMSWFVRIWPNRIQFILSFWVAAAVFQVDELSHICGAVFLPYILKA